MYQHVFVVHQRVGSREVTNGTLVHHQLWVAFLVFLEFHDIVEAFATGWAAVQQFGAVFFLHVVFDCFSIHVAFVTQVASEWLVVVVFDEMPLDVVFASEALRAQRTLVRFVTRVQPHVALHVVATGKGVVTHQAGVDVVLVQVVGLEGRAVRKDLEAAFTFNIFDWFDVGFRGFTVINVSRDVFIITLY